MKKIILIAVIAITGIALATPSYWAAAYTEAAKGDKSGGTAVGYYSGYYCSTAAAKDLFGVDTVSGLTTYFSVSENFDYGWKALKDNSSKGAGSIGTLGLSLKEFDHGQYALNSTYGDSLTTYGSAYLAVLLYVGESAQEFRVMASDTTESASGNAYFNDDGFSSSGEVGAWTMATVPEPTSGILLLLGVAGLALKRKNRLLTLGRGI